MASKKPNRRGFLKGGAAMAGLAAGAAGSASAQSQGMPTKKADELIAYGERSHFVTSIRRPWPIGIRPMSSVSCFTS